MIDTWLLVIIIIVAIAVAIEGVPEGFDKKAKTFRAEFAAIALIIIKRVASIILIVAKYIIRRIRGSNIWPEQGIKWKFTAPSIRVVIGTAVAVLCSPFAAIPMAIVYALLFFAFSLISGEEYDFAANGTDTLRDIIVYAFVVLISALDIIFRWALVALPFFTALGFMAASHAARSNRFARNLAFSTLKIGAAYPLIFLLATVLGADDVQLLS